MGKYWSLGYFLLLHGSRGIRIASLPCKCKMLSLLLVACAPWISFDCMHNCEEIVRCVEIEFCYSSFSSLRAPAVDLT